MASQEAKHFAVTVTAPRPAQFYQPKTPHRDRGTEFAQGQTRNGEHCRVRRPVQAMQGFDDPVRKIHKNHEPSRRTRRVSERREHGAWLGRCAEVFEKDTAWPGCARLSAQRRGRSREEGDLLGLRAASEKCAGKGKPRCIGNVHGEQGTGEVHGEGGSGVGLGHRTVGALCATGCTSSAALRSWLDSRGGKLRTVPTPG